MAGCCAAITFPFRPEITARARTDDHWAAPRCHLDRAGGCVRLVTGFAAGRSSRIGNQRRSARGQTGVPHVPQVIGLFFVARFHQRIIQTPIDAASATMKTGKPPIRVAQGPQGRCDTVNRCSDRHRHIAARFGQGFGDPRQKGQNFQQLFGIACRNPAFGVDLGLAVFGQGR